MAVTKIWTIKDSLQRVLDYAANPDKTEYDALAQTLHYAENDAKTKLNESAQLVTGIYCRADHAWEDMRAVQERFGKTDGVVALHAYQSFREGEVTPEQCHEIGVALARKVAGTDASVLLTGETGTGKDVFARAIHGGSSRSRENFVAVNCAAFTKELLESELFGHKAGAFTGAVKDKKGLLDEADGGTLFLDEIGEMAPELQAKLLRVLENGEYIRIGETRATKTDIRVIAATNRDLTREIAEGRFREDLFYRLSVFTIRLPSLADRPEDIEEYVRHFVGQFSQRMACRIVSIDPEYVRLMRRHAWRGNVRELRNVVERSMIMAEDGRLTAGDLPADFRGAEGGDADDPVSLGDMERRHIAKILKYTGGNKTEAARLLGIGIATLYRKIDEYGIGR